MIRQFRHRVACVLVVSPVRAKCTRLERAGESHVDVIAAAILSIAGGFHQLRPLMACWPAEVGKMVSRSELTRGKGVTYYRSRARFP